MKKKFLTAVKLILLNLFIFVLLIFLLDIIIYIYYGNIFDKKPNNCFKRPHFGYIIKPYYGIDFKKYFDGKDNISKGRLPDGLEYKNKVPIVVFGCSYAHGQFLNYNQTFSYKLSHVLKRPVYNRAVPGRGIQLMYWQSTLKDFYDEVPPSDTVIYILFHDHYRRMLINFIDLFDLHLTGHFNKKGNTLILDGKNYLKNLFISSYTFKTLNSKYVYWYIHNPRHAEEITDLALLYFVKTKRNLERRWNKKINFTIVFYNDAEMLYKNTLFEKLRNNGFNIIETDKLTDIDLNTEEYRNISNDHPTEKVWDILTPLIAEELKKQS